MNNKLYNFKRLKTFFFFTLAKLPMKGQWRCKYIKMGGGYIALITNRL